MAKPPNPLLDLAKSKGFTLKTLAEAAGVDPGKLTKAGQGKQRLQYADALAISRMMGVEVRELPVEVVRAPASDTTPPDTFTPQVIVPKSALVGERDFPIFAAARGSQEGHQIVTFEAIDYVKRPSLLERVKDAYGLYIEGESMIPAFEPGDMALVHPHLPPARDKNVVLYHVPPFTNAEAEAMVKRLLRFDDRDWHLRQFNPPEGEDRDFSVTRSDWLYCHRIVGKYEAR